MTSRKDRRIAELRTAIPEVEPAAAAADLAAERRLLIDVREPDEVLEGSPVGCARLVRGFLELRIEEFATDAATPIDLICAVGVRSLFAAEGLRQLGYTDVRSVVGGFRRWKEDGLPVEVPQSLTGEQRERYARHLLMPEVGEVGQQKLLDARVLLVGAGGLGSPAALYLAAAGVGTLGIVDDDVVERSNLQRQIVHTDARVGQPKVASARIALLGINPSVRIEEHAMRLDGANVDALLSDYDVIVDGSDNFATRYVVNDACVRAGKPNVHGSVFRFEGQVSVFWPAHPERDGPCYRCVFPSAPPPELAPSCAEAGVLGVLPGVVGTLEAIEAIKLILGLGDPLVGRMLHYDALAQHFFELKLQVDVGCFCQAMGS